jgi:hypothetical protein
VRGVGGLLCRAAQEVVVEDSGLAGEVRALPELAPVVILEVFRERSGFPCILGQDALGAAAEWVGLVGGDAAEGIGLSGLVAELVVGVIRAKKRGVRSG